MTAEPKCANAAQEACQSSGQHGFPQSAFGSSPSKSGTQENDLSGEGNTDIAKENDDENEREPVMRQVGQQRLKPVEHLHGSFWHHRRRIASQNYKSGPADCIPLTSIYAACEKQSLPQAAAAFDDLSKKSMHQYRFR
jgi:hypothetical protein